MKIYYEEDRKNMSILEKFLNGKYSLEMPIEKYIDSIKKDRNELLLKLNKGRTKKKYGRETRFTFQPFLTQIDLENYESMYKCLCGKIHHGISSINYTVVEDCRYEFDDGVEISQTDIYIQGMVDIAIQFCEVVCFYFKIDNNKLE